MPKLTSDELKARVAAGQVGAISLDTSIFDRHQCHLTYASLRKLDQFREGHVGVVISEVIANEVVSHIARDAEKSQRDLQNSLKLHARRWALSPEQAAAPEGFHLGVDPSAAAQEQFDAYVVATGATIIPSAYSATTAETVFARYFANQAPFEKSEKKKNEFPDGFALASLEEYGAEQDFLILCVSSDDGWQGYADTSAHLVCVVDLDGALALFNEAGQVVANRVLDLLRNGAAPTIGAGIESEFAYRLGTDFDVEASSYVDFEAEADSAELKSIDWAAVPEPAVIALDADSVTFTLELKAVVSYDANFSFYVRDSIDRDYISLGGAQTSRDQEDAFRIALTVSREMEGEPELFEAELARRRGTVDFGDVYPFEDEDPSHEKY